MLQELSVVEQRYLAVREVLDGAKVIFGPAARSLPQLRITVDDAGYLVAEGDFDQPVGPSFWERG